MSIWKLNEIFQNIICCNFSFLAKMMVSGSHKSYRDLETNTDLAVWSGPRPFEEVTVGICSICRWHNQCVSSIFWWPLFQLRGSASHDNCSDWCVCWDLLVGVFWSYFAFFHLYYNVILLSIFLILLRLTKMQHAQCSIAQSSISWTLWNWCWRLTL